MYIGIDLGGTKIAAGLADKRGKLVKKVTEKTEKTSAKAILFQLKKIINELSAEKKVLGLGIGIPGQVDHKGKIFNMPNLQVLKGFNLVKELKKSYKFPVVVENDANAAALAEKIYGAGKKYSNFIYITVSTGVGGGIVLNDKLYTGSHATAGEIGHMVLVPDGPQCGCGNKGCWESLGSGTALAKMAQAKVLEHEKTIMADLVQGDIAKINGEVIIKAAGRGDTVAKGLLQVNGFYNALGVVNLVNAFDPEVIIIGGGLSFNGKYFFNPLRQSLKLFKILNSKNKIKIIPAGCRKDSGLLGALSLIVSLKK